MYKRQPKHPSPAENKSQLYGLVCACCSSWAHTDDAYISYYEQPVKTLHHRAARAWGGGRPELQRPGRLIPPERIMQPLIISVKPIVRRVGCRLRPVEKTTRNGGPATAGSRGGCVTCWQPGTKHTHTHTHTHDGLSRRGRRIPTSSVRLANSKWANRPMREAHGLPQASQVHIIVPLAATGSFLAFRLATRAAVHLSSKANMAFEHTRARN